MAADGCAEPSAAGVVEARFFSSTGLSDSPSRSCSRPCRASMGPLLPGAVSGCALPAGSGRSAAPVPTLRPHVRQEAHWDTSCCGLIVSGPQYVAIEARTFVLIGSTFSRDPADAVEAGTRAGRTALRAHVRSRSLLLGVLGRGRECAPHPRTRSLSTRSTRSGIVAAGHLSSPAKWHHQNCGRPS